jgi:type IV pilus assembly protein PilE
MNTLIKGFTLAELMIVITIVAILITLSYPSYASFIRKADRTEAQVVLLDWANRQAVWRADNISYNEGISPVDDENYVYTIVSTVTSFTLTATAKGDQVDDKEDGISCSSLTINHAGVQGPSGYLECWG